MCESKVSMTGKVIIVTGANSGIGYYTAKDLALRGGRVILACRDEGRGLNAQKNISQETGNKEVIYKHLNLASLQSVRSFVADIIKTEQKVDVLVNNAGVYGGVASKYTEDGIVENMQVNHFAPFLLTVLLLPLLIKSRGRIINVSSICHFIGKIKLEHIDKAGRYGEFQAYANSKLCNILFTRKLARRLEGTGATANAVHPGNIWTNIILGQSTLIARIVFFAFCWICQRSVEEGAQSSIYLAVADECAGVSGKYYVDCTPRYFSPKARNEVLATQLWNYSEKLVGYHNETKS